MLRKEPHQHLIAHHDLCLWEAMFQGDTEPGKPLLSISPKWTEHTRA